MTKQLITDTLIKMMKHQDIDNIFVKDIAASANITRQTFYRYFKDKYDVINWNYDQEIESLFVQTYSIEGLRSNLIIKLEYFKKHMEFYKNAYSYKGQNSLVNHEFIRMYESLARKVECPTATPSDCRLSCSIKFFCYGVINLTIDWLNNSCQVPCLDFAITLIDLMPPDMASRIKRYE